MPWGLSNVQEGEQLRQRSRDVQQRALEAIAASERITTAHRGRTSRSPSPGPGPAGGRSRSVSPYYRSPSPAAYAYSGRSSRSPSPGLARQYGSPMGYAQLPPEQAAYVNELEARVDALQRSVEDMALGGGGAEGAAAAGYGSSGDEGARRRRMWSAPRPHR